MFDLHSSYVSVLSNLSTERRAEVLRVFVFIGKVGWVFIRFFFFSFLDTRELWGWGSTLNRQKQKNREQLRLNL